MSFLKAAVPALLLAFSLLAFFSACNDFKHLSKRGKLMVKNKHKMFRGLDFDMPLTEVKKSEGTQPDMEYPDYLRYRFAADSIAPGESLEVEYFFNKKDQLDLIIAFYNLTDTEEIKPLADELKRYLERDYGRPAQDEFGWYHWQFDDKTGEKGTVEINLAGETEEGYKGVELELTKYYEYEERVR